MKIDGVIVGTTYYDRSAFGVMPDGSFVFGTVSYNGTVKIDQVTLPVSGVNAERGENGLIIYNRAYGRSTDTNPYGLEYVIREGRVAEINTNDSLIPSDGYVVSVHGSSMDAFAAAGTRVGDPTALTEYTGAVPGRHPLRACATQCCRRDEDGQDRLCRGRWTAVAQPRADTDGVCRAARKIRRAERDQSRWGRIIGTLCR